jgi:hypothetical protein
MASSAQNVVDVLGGLASHAGDGADAGRLIGCIGEAAAMHLPVPALPGAASIVAVAIAAEMWVLITGLRSMSRPDLPFRDRRLIGRYMLLGMTAILLIAVVGAAIPHVNGSFPPVRMQSTGQRADEPLISPASLIDIGECQLFCVSSR